MQLLYPLGFLALAGLIIPLLIHLWSIKSGKVIKIGSVSLLENQSTSNSRSLRLTDILLFVIRCILLILIALLLAQPLLPIKSKNETTKGWILTDRSDFKRTYSLYRNEIDSLIKTGYELHDFNLGFKLFSLKDTAIQEEAKNELSYSSLINELRHQLPKGFSVFLYADKRWGHFSGGAPVIDFPLEWKDLKRADTLQAWDYSYLGRKYKANSLPGYTRYVSTVAENISPIEVQIFDPKQHDSKYVKAALQAISQFSERPIKISNWNSNDLGAVDFVFWLSGDAVPVNVKSKLKKGSTIFSYRDGRSVEVNSNLVFDSQVSNEVKLFKRIVDEGQAGVIWWKDGLGDVVLKQHRESNTDHFYFYSRFNPLWTNLVWEEEFVDVLYSLVIGRSRSSDFGYINHVSDQRVIANSQFFPRTSEYKNKHIGYEKLALSNWLWGLAGLVLVIERILSKKSKKDEG